MKSRIHIRARRNLAKRRRQETDPVVHLGRGIALALRPPEPPMTHDEMIALLQRMDSGDLDFWCEEYGWKETYAGDVTFVAADGHRIVVFNDCDQWDYVDSIFAPGGAKIWEFPQAVESDDDCRIINWTPKDMPRWENARVQEPA